MATNLPSWSELNDGPIRSDIENVWSSGSVLIFVMRTTCIDPRCKDGLRLKSAIIPRLPFGVKDTSMNSWKISFSNGW